MIILKSDEEKTLLFDVMVEGIDTKLLSFKFRLDVGGVEYGFPGIMEGEKVKIVIPSLGNILQESTIGVFQGKLEVMGDEKYYMKPWSGEVELKMEPKVMAVVEKTQDVVTENVKVKAFLTSEKSVVSEVKETVKKGKTNPSLRNKLA